jgi:hypothetical protein
VDCAPYCHHTVGSNQALFFNFGVLCVSSEAGRLESCGLRPASPLGRHDAARAFEAAGEPSRGRDSEPVGSDASLSGGLVRTGTLGLRNQAGGARYFLRIINFELPSLTS